MTAPATGMSSNMYSCQFFPMACACLGTSVVRLLFIISRCCGSFTILRMRSRNELMASRSLRPCPVPGASMTWLAASRLSLLTMFRTSAFLPSASRTISSLSHWA